MIAMANIEFQQLGPIWLEIAVAALVVTSLAFAIWSTRFQPLSTRVGVGLLRSLILLSVYGLLHQPTWIRQITRPQDTRIAVLTDRSGSMQSLDGRPQSRYQRALAAHQSVDVESAEIDYYEFDQISYGPMRRQAGELTSSGNKTDMYRAVTQMLNQTEDLAGIVMFSDGHDLGRFTAMDLDETKSWLERLGAPPINAVLVGETERGAEIAIHSLEAPAFSFVRAPLRIRATVMVRDISDPPSQIQLMESDKIVQVRDMNIDDQGFGTVDFEFYPETTGEHLYTVFVPPHPRETNQSNNKQHILIQIGRDKISVLHIAGSITWDLNGLRSMFERNDLVDLTAFYIMRTREHHQRGINGRNILPEEMALVPFPTEEIFDRQLFGFDVIIFQDFDAGNYFSDSYQARRLMTKIRNFIEQHHGGLIVIGGPRMASGPSLSLSPLADCLPITPPTYRSPYPETFQKSTITDIGKTHPLLQYYDPESDLIHGSMDKVGLHSQARVLLESESGLPLLATLQKGTGRVVFLNTSSSFEWLRRDIAEGRTGDDYYAFWNTMLGWATDDPRLQQVRITATKSTERPLDLDVTVLIRDSNYVPQEGMDATLILSPIGNQQDPVRAPIRTGNRGEAQAKITVTEPGYYQLAIEDPPWSDLAQPQIVFLGGSQDEFRNQEPVAETLERLASLSGGRFSRLQDLESSSFAWQSGDQKQIVEIRRLKLRNWIWSLPLLMMMAGLEWYLRRSSHLA